MSIDDVEGVINGGDPADEAAQRVFLASALLQRAQAVSGASPVQRAALRIELELLQEVAGELLIQVADQDPAKREETKQAMLEQFDRDRLAEFRRQQGLPPEGTSHIEVALREADEAKAARVALAPEAEAAQAAMAEASGDSIVVGDDEREQHL